MEPILLSACFLGILFCFVRWGIGALPGRPVALWTWIALGVAAAGLPLVRLIKPSVGFGYDWYNHEWMIAYFGEYFRQHLRFAPVFNSVTVIGMPQPVFYAFLAYPLLGCVSALVGAAWAIRVAACAALGLQFAAVVLAGRSTMRHRGLAFALAISSVGSVYALTNLYNRAALTEFFAASLLVSAVAFGVAAITTACARYMWCAGFAAALMFGCHPPTALLGGVFVAVLLAVALFSTETSRATRWTALAVAILVALTLAPWLYANAVTHSDLWILSRYTDLDLRSSGTDSLLGRFLPWPSEGWWKRPADGLPYIEAPLDGAVVILLVWNLVALARAPLSTLERRTRTAAWSGAVVSLVWLVAMTAISVSRPVADFARPLAPFVQFCSRLVTHANTGLLAATLFTGFLASRSGALQRRPAATSLFAALATIVALSGTAMKLRHAGALEEHRAEVQYAPAGDRANLILQPRIDAAADYATIRHMPQLPPRLARAARKIEFTPRASAGAFGAVPRVSIECAAPSWIVTNVVAFPWNRVIVDEHPIAIQRAEGWRAAFRVGAGYHVLRYEWQPSPTWSALRLCSELALLVLLVGVLVAGVRHSAPRDGETATGASPLEPTLGRDRSPG